MQFTIVSLNGNRTDVVAEESITPGLLLTQAIGWQDKYKTPKWHVTHKGTTQKITEGWLPKKHARLIAGALGGLPIDWTLSTQAEIYAESKKITDNALKHWLVRGVRE